MGAGGRRRTGVILIVLILIVLVLGGGAIAAALFLGGGPPAATGPDGQPAADTGEQVEPPTPTPPPVFNVIVARRDIPRGARMSAADVTIVAWPDTPETQPPLDVLIVDNEAEGLSLNQVDNRIARVDILAGQPIYNFMLTAADRPTSLADVGSDTALLIPSGFVAVSIPATRLGLVGYSLREGDHVDLLASFRFVDMDEGFQTSLANVGILIDRDPEFPLNGFTFDIGRVEGGPIGATLLVTPGEELQRSRQSTQMIIDNVIVLGVGNFPIEDLHQPIVIEAATPPPVEEGEAAEGDAAQEQAAVEEATPVPEVVPPDLLTLVMTRQDALVLKYAIETGSDLTVVLRSALDDEVNVQPTDSVTLDYILNFYGVDRPPALDIAHEPSLQAIDAIHFDFFQSVLTPELEVSRNAIESGAP